MIADTIRALFAWGIQEDRRLWHEVIMALPESAFTVDTGYSWGSLQAECVHVVDVMHASLQRLHGIKATTVAVTIDNPSREQVRPVWDQVEARWAAYMAELDDAQFMQEIEIVYRDTEMTTPRWQTIFHFFNHNTLHRAEMRQMAAALGGTAASEVSFAAHCLANSG